MAKTKNTEIAAVANNAGYLALKDFNLGDALNEELPGWLDGLVNVYEQTRVSVRKSTKKSK